MGKAIEKMWNERYELIEREVKQREMYNDKKYQSRK